MSILEVFDLWRVSLLNSLTIVSGLSFLRRFNIYMVQRVLIVFFVCMALLGCSSGGGKGGETNNVPREDPQPIPQYTITTDVDAVTFEVRRNLHDESPIAEKSVLVTFDGEGLLVGYPAGTPEAQWLVQPTLSDLGEGRAELRLQPAVGKSSSPQTWSTRIRLMTGRADGTGLVAKDLTVRLIITDHLDIRHEGDFDIVVGATGDSASGLQFAVETWAARWEIQDAPDWLVFSPTRGEGTPFEDPQIVTVGVDSSKLSDTETTTSFTLQQIDGGIKTVQTVNLRVEPERIWFSKAHTFFTLFNGESGSGASVSLLSNKAATFADISLTTEAPWLSLIKAGDGLDLFADAQNLTPGMYFAEIHAERDGAVVSIEPLVVGLYVQDSDRPADATRSLFYDEQNPAIVLDPIRPFVYAITEAGVKTINYYTGVQVGEVPLPTGDRLYYTLHRPEEAPHYVSRDGRVLYIHNAFGDGYSSGGETHVYHRYDLQELRWLDDVPMEANTPEHLVDGVPLRFGGGHYRTFVNSATGSQVDFSGSCGANVLQNGELMYGLINVVGSEYAFSVEMPRFFSRVNKMVCENSARLFPDTNSEPIYRNNFAVSDDGESLLVERSLYRRDTDASFQKAATLGLYGELKTAFESNYPVRYLYGLIHPNGHVFVAYAGSENPHYISEYDSEGTHIRTLQQAEFYGGQIAKISFTEDGRSLLVQHLYDYGSVPASYRIISID